MMERVHDRDTLQCRIKVKELRSAYCKARDTNGRSGAPPTTCRFYKELDAILGVNPTSTPSTTMDTSEPGWGGRRRRKTGVMVVGWMETPRNPWSHAARSSSQARRKVASRSAASTLRPQPSLLSPAQRLQRLRKRPRKSKEDMLQEVMHQSIKENEKAQNWRERESRIRQKNAAHQRQSTAHRQQSTDWLITILERQADAIQELIAMQKEEQYRKRPPPTALVPKFFPLCPTVTSNPTFPNFRVFHTTYRLQHQYLHHPALKTTTFTLCTQPPSPCSIAVLKCSTHCTAYQTGYTRIYDCTVPHSTPLFLFNKWIFWL
ncbi:uncharacterized protein LOC128848859 isoform X1 [Malaclemys terrapin pileata]|uniref:uncharacterized protein LOC128848859 isoform X1 n=1 Tax=Malaclemys terrapin pileata TaxID=2991368 RepID=UPI0023A87E40|nr:uncharacterized protein LOC128848859 isoform X1 [Malaclemys terrapin pileata]